MKKEVIAKFYSTYRLYLFPAIVVLSSLFLIVFAIYPQTVKLIENRKVISDLAGKSKFLETKVTALESLDREDLSRKVEVVLGVYPADKDFGNILGLLQQTVEEFGFSITSISLAGSANKSGNAESYGAKLEIQGSRALLPVLLNNLESSYRLIRISGIDALSSKTSQSLDTSLMIEVLYSKPPQTFGTADSPLPDLSQKDEDLIATLAEMSRSAQTPQTMPLSPRGKSNPFE